MVQQKDIVPSLGEEVREMWQVVEFGERLSKGGVLVEGKAGVARVCGARGRCSSVYFNLDLYKQQNSPRL